MKYSLGNIELSINDEIMLKSELEKRAGVPDARNAFYFDKAVEAYSEYDFSELSEFDGMEIDKVRERFAQDIELSSRPLIFVMYIFHRNGFLKPDYLTDPKRTFDMSTETFTKTQRLDVPEGLILEDGKFYGIGKDGHIWLFNYLNLKGIDTTDCVRYSQFTDSDTKVRQQHFSRLKEDFSESGSEDSRYSKKLIISDAQAIAINNLRRKYNSNIPLQKFLLEHTANMGFGERDSYIALKYNFKTFADMFPEERKVMSEIVEIKNLQKMVVESLERR